MATGILDLLPLELPIWLTRGSKKVVRLTFINLVTGQPIDLTGKTVRWIVKAGKDETLPVLYQRDAAAVDVVNGVMDLTIPEDNDLGNPGAVVTYQHTIWIVEDHLDWWAGPLTVYATTGLT